MSAKRDAGCAVPIEDFRGRLLEVEDDPDLEGALEGIPGGREPGRRGTDLEVSSIEKQRLQT